MALTLLASLCRPPQDWFPDQSFKARVRSLPRCTQVVSKSLELWCRNRCCLRQLWPLPTKARTHAKRAADGEKHRYTAETMDLAGDGKEPAADQHWNQVLHRGALRDLVHDAALSKAQSSLHVCAIRNRPPARIPRYAWHHWVGHTHSPSSLNHHHVQLETHKMPPIPRAFARHVRVCKSLYPVILEKA